MHYNPEHRRKPWNRAQWVLTEQRAQERKPRERRSLSRLSSSESRSTEQTREISLISHKVSRNARRRSYQRELYLAFHHHNIICNTRRTICRYSEAFPIVFFGESL